MAGISSYEKAALGLTAAVLIFTGGWFLAERNSAKPYEVTAARNLPEAVGPAQTDRSEQEGRPDSLLEGEVIDLNTADAYDLRRLPGIGETRAQAIIADREEHGPFQTVDDLDRVEGIGPGILDGLREYATVTEVEEIKHG